MYLFANIRHKAPFPTCRELPRGTHHKPVTFGFGLDKDGEIVPLLCVHYEVEESEAYDGSYVHTYKFAAPNELSEVPEWL